VWFAIQDPKSRAKLFVNIMTTPGSLGSPTPALVVLGVTPTTNSTWKSLNNWFYLPIPLPSGFTTSTAPPALVSPLSSLSYDPQTARFHLVVQAAPFISADLTLHGPPGGATLPAIWDGQTSFWTQALGTGVAEGTITFPGSATPTPVHGWSAEQETQAGTYELGGGIGGGVLSPSPHIGYYYGQADYPDGSASTLYVFPELDGSIRGILTHTTARGKTTECEPSQPGGVHVSDWYTDPSGLEYPLTISGRCAGLSLTLTTTPSASSAMTIALPIDGFASEQSIAAAPGATAAWMQHVADVGYLHRVP
jgi:hypothetical protein